MQKSLGEINSLNSCQWVAHPWVCTLEHVLRTVFGNWKDPRIWRGRKVGSVENPKKDKLHPLFSCAETQSCLSFTCYLCPLPLPCIPPTKSWAERKKAGGSEKRTKRTTTNCLSLRVTEVSGKEGTGTSLTTCFAKHRNSKSFRSKRSNRTCGP